MALRPALALLALAACKFPPPPDVGDDAASTATDASLDGTATCQPSTITCDDARGEYVACSASGTVELALHCPLGCAPDEEKCLDIDPHNGLAAYLDMVANPPDIALDRAAIIDSNAGAILNGGISVPIPTLSMRVAVGPSPAPFGSQAPVVAPVASSCSRLHRSCWTAQRLRCRRRAAVAPVAVRPRQQATVPTGVSMRHRRPAEPLRRSRREVLAEDSRLPEAAPPVKLRTATAEAEAQAQARRSCSPRPA